MVLKKKFLLNNQPICIPWMMHFFQAIVECVPLSLFMALWSGFLGYELTFLGTLNALSYQIDTRFRLD